MCNQTYEKTVEIIMRKEIEKMNQNDARNKIDIGKCEIIREYNYAVDLFNEVFNYTLQYDLDKKCIEKLVNVGESLYEVYEKTMKRVVYQFYYNQVLDGMMTLSDFEKLVDLPLDTGKGTNIFNAPINIKTLCKWMAEYGNPQLQVWDSTGNLISTRLTGAPIVIPKAEIDTDILRNYAGVAHNDNKHKFYYSADSQLMLICNEIFPYIENIIKRYVAETDSQIKKYGIKINSGIYQIDNHFNAWNETSYYKYVLIVDDVYLKPDEKRALVSLPWAIIVDFDIQSCQGGLLKSYIENKKKTPIILTPSAVDNYDFSVVDTCWFFPNGRVEESQYLVDSENKWRRNARKNMQNLLAQYHSKVRSPLKILVLDKKNAKRTGDILLDFFDEYQGESEEAIIDIVSLSNDILHESANYITEKGQNLYSFYNVEVTDLVNYINVNIVPQVNANDDERKVPIRGTLRTIDTKRYGTFTVLDTRIAKREENVFEKIDKMKFYYGETKISWYGIQHQFPVEWTEYYEILHNVETSLGSVKSPIKLILHEPGAGGTTFLRMYAYERSKRQPTIVINQYSLKQVADEISQLYLECGKTPICICADSADLTYDQCLELKDALDALSLAHDFIYAHRIGISTECFCQIVELRGDTLNLMKTHLFESIDQISEKDMLRPKESRKQDIAYIVSSSDRLSERMPLIMSMYAFDDRYKGTESYIHNFLIDLSESQRQQLLFAALIDIYAGTKIEITFFDERHEIFDKYGNHRYYVFEGTRGELASDKLFTFGEKESGVYTQIKHPQFSKKIIAELIPQNENKITYYQSLVRCFCDLIAFCAKPETYNSEKLMDLLSILFITKNQDALDETTSKHYFGPIVDKLYREIEDNVLRVNLIDKIFDKLTKTYAKNPHFVAHYGRYYSIIAKEYEKGIRQARKAVEMAENEDETLYHILATTIRRYIRHLVNTFSKYSTNETVEKEKQILQLAEDASKYYKLSRKNRNYAGYISDIEMCIIIVDFAAQGDYKRVIKDIDCIYHEYYERAISLYRELTSKDAMLVSRGDVSFRISNLESKIQALLANLGNTITYWEGQVKREKNPEKLYTDRGLLVEAILNGDTHNMTDARINQCIECMERNLDYRYRYSDLSYWFELITIMHKENDYDFLVEKDTKLREWIEINPSTVELYYYQFIIDSLLALNKNSRYSASMKVIASRLNSLTYLYKGNTIPRKILSGKGNKLKDLMPINVVDDELRDTATNLIGIVDSGRLATGNPLIYCDGIPVYFNIDRQHFFKKNRPGETVNFKMVYTLQGAMALENSVISSESIKKDSVVVRTEKVQGSKIECRFLRKGTNGSIIVEMEDFNNEHGLIYASDFKKGDVMKEGDIRKLVIRDNTKVKFKGKKYWRMIVDN